MLDAEGDTDLVLSALLDNQGGLLGSVNLSLRVELEGGRLVVLLEDDGELRDHNAARIVLGRDIVGVNTYGAQDLLVPMDPKVDALIRFNILEQ